MMWGDYERPMHDGWSVGGWLLLVLVLLFFAALLATVVYLLLRTTSPSPRGPQSHQPSLHTAEQLLAERYARGELDEEEYRHRREVLRL